MGLKLKRGDTVVVISGKEKGKRGEIERVIPKENRVVVGGVNVRTRHARPSQQNQQGLYHFDAPIDVSNVMLVDPNSGEPTRVGYRFTDSGRSSGSRRSQGRISMARLKERYHEEVVPDLEERFGIENPMRMPGLEKIVVNMGVGEAVVNSRALDGAMEDLARITGQKAQLRRARKSIAGFKIREGMPVGARVTLRGERMWEFLDRFISIALPRVRDFRGVSPASFDGHGNYAIGLREQVIFPEISYDSIDATRGLDVAIVTTTESDEEARELLRLLGMPFRQS